MNQIELYKLPPFHAHFNAATHQQHESFDWLVVLNEGRTCSAHGHGHVRAMRTHTYPFWKNFHSFFILNETCFCLLTAGYYSPIVF